MQFFRVGNDDGLRKLAQSIGVITILAVAGYCDIIFMQIVWSLFPDGLLKDVAMIGALANFSAVLVLLIGKSKWFRPGLQLTFSWVFSAIELAVMIANVVLSFELHSNKVDQFMQLWYTLCPASPVISMLGIFLLFYLDRDTEETHELMQMEDTKRKLNREYEIAEFQAEVEIKHAYLDQTRKAVKDYLGSAKHQSDVTKYGEELSQKVLSQVTGQRMGQQNNNSVIPLQVATPTKSPLFNGTAQQKN